MNIELVPLLAVLGVTIAVGGLIYGLTGRSPQRRGAGLRVLQFGMASAGLVAIIGGMLVGPPDLAIYGLLLLVLGTGITAIGTGTKS